jgi:hypothetical protein
MAVQYIQKKEFEMKAVETACRNLAKMMKIFGVKIGGNREMDTVLVITYFYAF